MEFKERSYQAECIDMIINKPYIGLYLDMGLGKTVITLTAIQRLLRNKEVNKVLIIAPKKVAEMTWSAEIDKWDHLQDLTYSPILGSLKAKKEGVDREADIYITNRESTDWLVSTYCFSWPWDMVVIDESSSFKRRQSKRTRALMRIRPKLSRVVELSGTPSPNSLVDLWSQLYILDLGERLGATLSGFKSRYFWQTPTPWGVPQLTPKSDARAYITGKISDICYSMRAEDYLDLPDMMEQDLPVVLSPKAAKYYKELERTQVLELMDGTLTASNAAAVTTKLLQMAGGAVYRSDAEGWVPIHDDKLQALGEVLEGLDGASCIIYYQYQHELERISKLLNTMGIKYGTLASQDEKDLWDSGDLQVLLLHPASAAYGLNLQHGGHHIIWYSLTYNYEHYVQANARLHRSGQDKPVIVHRLICKGTRDEDVAKALTGKDQCQQYILESLKSLVTRYQMERGIK